MNITDFIQQLASRGVTVNKTRNGYDACCPAHSDSNASLSISVGHDQRILLHCHAGCSNESIVTAIGLDLADLFSVTTGTKNGSKRKIVETYSYADEMDKVLFQCVRYEPKDFRQRRPDPQKQGAWIWNLSGVRRVLYRQREIAEAVKAGITIFVAEGEKDVNVLMHHGLAATCCPMGAGKWMPEHSETLRDAVRVVVIADNDAPGRQHAQAVGTALHGMAKSVKVILLPEVDGKPVKDSADFFAAGGTVEQLSALVDATPEFVPMSGENLVEAGNMQSEHPASVASPRTEFEFADLLAKKLPPIKTVGNVWNVYRNGVWRPQDVDTFKPDALAAMPESVRTIRLASSVLNHIAGSKQTDPDTFKGFYVFDPSGAVLINAGNCIVRVTKSGFERLPHSKEYHFTRQTVARFDPRASVPLFSRVLLEALPDAEDRELFRLFLGNILLPDSRFEASLICYGEGGRGKSTVADPVAVALGVDLVTRLSLPQICDPRSYHLPGLRNAAVNLGTELTTADIAESGNFKTLVSGEPVQARPIYGKPFVMQTACKFWSLANNLPRFQDGTQAEIRRTRFLRFDCVPQHTDVTMKARLAEERDGVFLFMLEGLRALLVLPEIPSGGRESRAVLERFKINNDPVGAFAKACCEFSESGLTKKETVQQAVSEFVTSHALRPSSTDKFFRDLLERYNLAVTQPRVAGGARERHVAGLSLRSPQIEITE